MGMKTIEQKLGPIYKEDLNSHIPTMLSIITSRHCARISTGDIEMLEQSGRVLYIKTIDKEYRVYESINSVAGYLKGGSFYRPLQSIIINFDHVKSIEDAYVFFDSGETVTMGRNTLCRTRMAYRQYLQMCTSYMFNAKGTYVAENPIDS